MARKKRDDTTVKISSAIYHKAKQVASYRHVHLAELLSELLEKPVEREYQKMFDEMQKQSDKNQRE